MRWTITCCYRVASFLCFVFVLQGDENATETAINGMSGSMGVDSVSLHLLSVCVSPCEQMSLLFDKFVHFILRTLYIRWLGREADNSSLLSMSIISCLTFNHVNRMLLYLESLATKSTIKSRETARLVLKRARVWSM